jgi:hypothetical protein
LIGKEWLKLAPDHVDVLWQSEHCPGKWLAGRAWQDWQSVAPAAAWSKWAGFQAPVLWQAEHCPLKWPPGRWWQDWQSVAPATS